MTNPAFVPALHQPQTNNLPPETLMKKLSLILALTALSLTACDKPKTDTAKPAVSATQASAGFRRHLQRRAALRQLRRD